MNDIHIHKIDNGFVLSGYRDDGTQTEIYCCDLFDLKKALDAAFSEAVHPREPHRG